MASAAASVADAVQEAILAALADAPEGAGVIEDTARLSVPDAPQPLDQQVVLGVLKRLEAHGAALHEAREEEVWVLTEEGAGVAEKGSHEARFYALVDAGGAPTAVADVVAALGEAIGNIGLGKAFAKKWVSKAGDDAVVRAVPAVADTTAEELRALVRGETLPEATLRELRKRRLVGREKRVSFRVLRGPSYARTLARAATDLTADMLAGRAWERTSFKAYNYDAAGLPTAGGALHPLLKVREEFRQLFLEMGFSEMPTNRFVESSFWNFDALFQPQHHPSRDAHDTFFLAAPARCGPLPDDYALRVQETHETGGASGSLGHRCSWSPDEARKNILRTHTTAVSSRMLQALGEACARGEAFRPAKLFSIDRVFRNETLDATHLAEFHQIEGLVADRGLTLGDLVGMLRAFFARLGMTRLRFKPAFNPYTEPSMEVFALHPGLGRWIEVGNSGVFRPEMLVPMGLPADVSVIAWGLSLERPTMIKYGISNIRDLFGHKVDLAIVQANPICRLDK